jgi:hypothetical protein
MNLSYLYAWEIRPGILPQVLHPSAKKLNPPGRDCDVLVNTPTLTWEYTWTFEDGKRRDPPDSIGGFSNPMGCSLSI